MDSGIITALGTLGSLAGGAAYFTNLAVNGFTLAWPNRPSWAAWAASMVFGLILTVILAAASLPLEAVWTRQTWAQIVLVGLLAGAGAGGANGLQKKSDEKRVDAETLEQLRRSRP